VKRILDCTASDFATMTGQELKLSIAAAEGRTVLAEVIGSFPPFFPSVTNAELASAFGADIILLNLFDVFNPGVLGLKVADPDTVVRTLRTMIGRPVGLNLEPVDPTARPAESLTGLPPGRIASAQALQRAKDLGFDFVCLTGNPKTGVSNQEIVKAIQVAREVLGPDGLIIAGKMHSAGVADEIGSRIMSADTVHAFVEAGADVILIPSPGTIPGVTLEGASELVNAAHAGGALAMLATGTSQEGSDEATTRHIALTSKMAGADIFHLGDAGVPGIAVPENITTCSVAVRGIRHTYFRMATSIHR